MSLISNEEKKNISWCISFLVNSPLNQRRLIKQLSLFRRSDVACSKTTLKNLTHYTQHDVTLSDASHSYKHKSTVLASFALCSLTVSHFSGGQEVCRHTTKRRLLSVSLQVVTILLHSDWTSQQGAASAFNKKSPLSIWTVLKLS